MTIWKPIATAAGCTALLGLVAGMKIPTEMVYAAEPAWRTKAEKTFASGSDDRPLYEAGPEDLYVPRHNPMSRRVAYDAMEYMNERAVGPGPVPAELTRPAQLQERLATREIMPVALTPQDVAPTRAVVVPGPGEAGAVVRVVSGTGGTPATAEVAEPTAPLELTEVAAIPQT